MTLSDAYRRGHAVVALMAAAGAATLPLPADVAAQSPPPGSSATAALATPSGLWWSAGVGAGSLRFQCTICATSRDLGPVIDVAVGSWARPGLAVGLDAGMWTFDDRGTRETALHAGLLTHFYPNPARGLHLIAGVGWTGWRADDFAYDAVRVSAGAGWDVASVGGFVVGNALKLEGAAFGGLRNDDRVVVDDAGLSVVRFQVYVKRR